MDEEREASNRFLVSEAQLLAEKACMVVPLTRSLTDQAAREDARNQNASRPSETPLSCRGRLLRLRSRKILRGWERVQVLWKSWILRCVSICCRRVWFWHDWFIGLSDWQSTTSVQRPHRPCRRHCVQWQGCRLGRPEGLDFGFLGSSALASAISSHAETDDEQSIKLWDTDVRLVVLLSDSPPTEWIGTDKAAYLVNPGRPLGLCQMFPRHPFTESACLRWIG